MRTQILTELSQYTLYIMRSLRVATLQKKNSSHLSKISKVSLHIVTLERHFSGPRQKPLKKDRYFLTNVLNE